MAFMSYTLCPMIPLSQRVRPVRRTLLILVVYFFGFGILGLGGLECGVVMRHIFVHLVLIRSASSKQACNGYPLLLSFEDLIIIIFIRLLGGTIDACCVNRSPRNLVSSTACSPPVSETPSLWHSVITEVRWFGCRCGEECHSRSTASMQREIVCWKLRMPVVGLERTCSVPFISDTYTLSYFWQEKLLALIPFYIGSWPSNTGSFRLSNKLFSLRQ